MNPLHVNRRRFFRLFSLGSAAIAISPGTSAKSTSEKNLQQEKPKTNGEDALNYPRTPNSMPGIFPARVIRVDHPGAVKDQQPDDRIADIMIEKGMLELTGESNLQAAWLKFVSPSDRIGLKVNPVAGKALTTSHAVVKAVIRQLKAAGIPESQIVIWDRREFELHETGFTAENYPGIKITGTERQDSNGAFYGEDGKLLSEHMIDKNWYYWADVEEKYDEYTLPYMVNEGKYSYFTKICTEQLDKIINIPILKNAGSSVTLAMKNLAYGAVTNTGRLHKDLWAETCAEVCAFPPLRDKVVLNIVDGLRGCYNGGPAANPQFIINYNTILFATDPVAIDRIGYDIVLKKRIEMQVQKEDNPRAMKFMELANKLGLGEHDYSKIDLKTINLG